MNEKSSMKFYNTADTKDKTSGINVAGSHSY